MPITRDQFLDILDTLPHVGSFDPPKSYSGRAMYGKKCVALIDHEARSEWDIAIAVAIAARQDGLDPRQIPSPNVDAMGRGFVLYWPQYEWPEGRTCPDEYDPDGDEYA